MNYNLLFVDVGMDDSTVLHKFNVITGDNVDVQFIKGDWNTQMFVLTRVILLDRPDKIIFDNSQFGYTFKKEFIKKLEYLSDEDVFTIDAFGLITYGGDNNHEDGYKESL